MVTTPLDGCSRRLGVFLLSSGTVSGARMVTTPLHRGQVSFARVAAARRQQLGHRPVAGPRLQGQQVLKLWG
jgi:hypothetical protein